jgi:hypothetical protein
MVPTFAPATDDAAGSDEVNVTTCGGDEVTDDLPLLPTFAPATDDAAGSDEVNVATCGDEVADDLPLVPSTSSHYCYSPPSRTRPGLSASIHAPSPQRKGLSASIHASSSPSEDFIYVPSYPRRPDLSGSIYAPSSPPRPDRSASIHAPCTPPKRGLNASIHAPPSQHEPMEPKPIPVVDLSPQAERRTRRVNDPPMQV